MEDIFKYKDCITPVKKIPSINIYGVDKVGDKVPTFTIAIPTYKRVTTLSETIESALAQKEFNDYYVIVVDNNPERGDDTEVFMEQYRHNSKVTYYKNSENVGMAGNWNKCALLSQSAYFILLHDDDIISPYALLTFDKIIKTVETPFSLIKPQLQKFSNISELRFTDTDSIKLQKRTPFDYFGGDCTGAPTIALFSRTCYIQVGGTNQELYPSFDYVLSFSLNRLAPTYTFDMILGGYRVGENESLSSKTMDAFFDMKVLINNQIGEYYHVPKSIMKVILSLEVNMSYNYEKQYYNMPDYWLDINKYHLFDTKKMWIKIFSKLYYSGILRIHYLCHRKKIILK